MPISKSIYTFIVTISACLALMGCDEHVHFHAYQPISLQGWEKRDTVTFTIDSIPHKGTYQFEIGIRTAGTCPYQAIWLIVHRELTHPYLSRTDTIKCTFVDAVSYKTGKGIYTHQYVFPLPALDLRQKQHCKIRISHFMKKETLSGICDIGLKVHQ